MSYLLDLGFSNETIDEILKVNGEAISLSFECNEESISNIINYLNYIGIRNIDDLLIYEVDFFLNDFEDVKSMIKNEDYDIINSINNDYTYIENLD